MSETAILIIGGRVIVPIQSELHDNEARRLQQDILQKIERTGADGLLIDVSAVGVIDSFLARLLAETARMAALMGARTVLAGMKKEVVLTLIHLGVSMKNIHTALNIEDGLALIGRLTGNEP